MEAPREIRFMKRIEITHRIEYYYNTPVIFGAPRALVRPREGARRPHRELSA